MRIHGTDMGIKCGTVVIKCVILMSFSPLFTFLCFRFMFFCNGIQRRNAYYS
jgi:hypothetical protein